MKLTKKSSLIDFEKLWVPFWDLLRRLVFGIVDVIFGRRGIVFVFSKKIWLNYCIKFYLIIIINIRELLQILYYVSQNWSLTYSHHSMIFLRIACETLGMGSCSSASAWSPMSCNICQMIFDCLMTETSTVISCWSIDTKVTCPVIFYRSLKAEEILLRVS